ncbi:MAG: SufD family Fe-S cluster assembly protein [Thermoplasmata archaeon]
MALATAPETLTPRPDHLTRLSEQLGDSGTRRSERLRDLRLAEELPIEPNPLYRKYGYFAGVDLAHLDLTRTGPPVAIPSPLPGAVQIVHDISGTRVHLPPELQRGGVGWSSPSPTTSDDAAPEDRLSALARALINRSYRLTVPDGLPTPLRIQEISVLSEPGQSLSIDRQLRVGRESQVLFTEEVFSLPAGAAQRFLGSATHWDLGLDTKVVHLTVHAPDPGVVSVYRRGAVAGERARLAWIYVGLGGFRTKIRNQTRLHGAGAAVDDLQTFFGAGTQSYDSAIDMTHEGTDTHGRSITRGVFRDEARGMSRGRVRIEADARKTVSFISEHAMLLSKGARSDTIPILEILCRDVKATHSTSVAPVDPERVFYLESRGHPASSAIRMIGEGFLAYVLEHAPIASLRDLLYPTLSRRWDGENITWGPLEFPTLPELSVVGTETDPEWRFDAKLR